MLQNQRILVVDDDSELRDALVRAVRAAGCKTVTVAANENDGMLLGSILPFDLIITDLAMPEGMELIRWFRNVQPYAKIIAISGAQGVSPQAAQLPGATAVLHKPFSSDAFLNTVRDVLRS